MLKKNLAGAFAFFLGIFGAHHFYLGNRGKGIVNFAAFWILVFLTAESGGEELFGMMLGALAVFSALTGIMYWATPYRKWAAKHDPEGLTEYEARQYGPPALAAPVRDTASIKAEGVRYFRSGDFDLSAEAFEEAILIDPTDPVSHFNLACSLARMGKEHRALAHLERAVTYELPGPQRIMDHPALASLRDTAAFHTFADNNYRLKNYTAPAAPRPEIVEDEAAGTTPAEAQREAPPSAAKPATNDDLLEQINRLRELQDAGILTRDEFQRQRERLLEIRR